ncbi:MAG: transposase [Chloroflexota bacterium]
MVRYQRIAERPDYCNGFYERNLGTTMGVIEELPVPRTCHGFRTELFKRYPHRQAELDGATLEMFIKGVSTVQVGSVIETLTGAHPSTVSRVFRSLEGEFARWKERSLRSR